MGPARRRRGGGGRVPLCHVVVPSSPAMEAVDRDRRPLLLHRVAQPSALGVGVVELASDVLVDAHASGEGSRDQQA